MGSGKRKKIAVSGGGAEALSEVAAAAEAAEGAAREAPAAAKSAKAVLRKAAAIAGASSAEHGGFAATSHLKVKFNANANANANGSGKGKGSNVETSSGKNKEKSNANAQASAKAATAAAFPKKSYKPWAVMETLYTGGRVAPLPDSRLVACPCADSVKIVDVGSGTVVRTMASGDGEAVTAVAASPDGVSVFASGRSLQTKWWDWQANTCRRSWKAHEGVVMAMAVDASGGLLATAGTERCVRVWDVEGEDGSSSSCTHSFSGLGSLVTCLAFHPDPNRLLLFAGLEDGRMVAWDLVTRRKAATLSDKHFSAVTSIAFSPSGWLLISAGRDKVVNEWDTRKWRHVRTLPVFESLEGVCTLPHPRDHALLQLLHGSGSQQQQQQQTTAAAPATATTAAADSSLFVTVGERGILRVWSTDRSTCLLEHTAHELSAQRAAHARHTDPSSADPSASVGKAEGEGEGEGALADSSAPSFTSIQLLPAVRSPSPPSSSSSSSPSASSSFLFLCTTTDDRLLLYSLEQPLQQAKAQNGAPAAAGEGGEEDEEKGVEGLSRSGKRKRSKGGKTGHVDSSLAAEADGLGRACCFRFAEQLIGRSEEIVDLRFLDGIEKEDERYLAVATNSEQIRIHSVPTMSCVRALIGHTDIVLCLDTWRSTATGRVLIASCGKDHTVRVWDAATGACLAVGQGHTAAVSAVALSRRSSAHASASSSATSSTSPFLLSASSDRTLKLWSLAPVMPRLLSSAVDVAVEPPLHLRSLTTVAAHDKDINAVAVAPNDSLACTGSQDRTAKVWKLPELSLALTLRGHKRGVWCCAFSPVDRCVLTASGDATVRVWALADGACLKTLQGHGASVLKAVFATRGTQVVSAGADGLVKLWNLRTSECVNTFDSHEDKVWALAISDKDEALATGGSDSTVVVWRDSTQEDAHQEALQEAEELEKEQEMGVAAAHEDFTRALELAFELRRPLKMMNLFKQLFKRPDSERQLVLLMRSLLKDAGKADEEDRKADGVEGKGKGRQRLRQLLLYCREWNSNAKLCLPAQAVLRAVFATHPPSSLLKVPGVAELLDGLQPYTERHLSRLSRALEASRLLDFTLASMSVLSQTEEDGRMEELRERA